MKIHKKIGSKERLFEVFQNVNKIKINETSELFNVEDIVNSEFENLKNGVLNIKQTKTQTKNNETYVDLICGDNDNNVISFTFKTTLSEEDQDGVYGINDVKLIKFNFKSKDNNSNIDVDENQLKDFNDKNSSEFYNVIEEYVDVNDQNIDDSLYEESIKLIDKIPYKNGSENMQTHKQYADSKPTNSNVRVDSPELNKFVNEENISVSEKDKKIILQAYDNLINKGIESPTIDQIFNEIEIISGRKTEKIKKAVSGDHMIGNRVYPSFAEKFLDENGVDATKISDAYYGSLTPLAKNALIIIAKKIVDDEINAKKLNPTHSEIVQMIKERARRLYEENLAYLNEDNSNAIPFSQLSDDKKNVIIKAHYNLTRKVGKPEYSPTIPEMQKEIDRLISSKEFEISENKNGEDVLKNKYNSLYADLDFGRMSDAYQKLLNIKHGDFRKNDLMQQTLSSLRDSITKYLNNVKGIDVDQEDVQNYFENQAQFSTVMENQDLSKSSYKVGEFYEDKGNYLGIKTIKGVKYHTFKRHDADSSFPEYGKKYYTEKVLGFDKSTVTENDDVATESNIDNLIDDKETSGDILQGGLGDDKSPLEFDIDQLIMGINVEMEHTDNPMVAFEIAMDHLCEMGDYYTNLDKMENGTGAELEQKKSPDEELTNGLLGFKR